MTVKNVMVNSVVVLISLLIPITIFELYIAYQSKNYQTLSKHSQIYNVIRHNYVRHSVNIIQMSDDCARYDQQLTYTLKPGKCLFENLEFSTRYNINSVGLRDDERSLNAPDIITLGDSYAMGWGVEQDETFSDLIERNIAYRVLNAGISSYGTARQVGLLSRLDKTRLKYIIWQYSENDFAENRAYVNNNFNLNISTREDYEKIKARVQKRKYSLFMYFGRFMKQITQQISGVELYSEFRNTNDEEITYLLKTIQNANLPESVKIILFEISGPEYLNNGFADRLKDNLEKKEFMALKKQIIIMDVKDILNKDQDYFMIDTHINRLGHHKISSHLIHIINSHY